MFSTADSVPSPPDWLASPLIITLIYRLIPSLYIFHQLHTYFSSPYYYYYLLSSSLVFDYKQYTQYILFSLVLSIQILNRWTYFPGNRQSLTSPYQYLMQIKIFLRHHFHFNKNRLLD